MIEILFIIGVVVLFLSLITEELGYLLAGLVIIGISGGLLLSKNNDETSLIDLNKTYYLKGTPTEVKVEDCNCSDYKLQYLSQYNHPVNLEIVKDSLWSYIDTIAVDLQIQENIDKSTEASEDISKYFQ